MYTWQFMQECLMHFPPLMEEAKVSVKKMTGALGRKNGSVVS